MEGIHVHKKCRLVMELTVVTDNILYKYQPIQEVRNETKPLEDVKHQIFKTTKSIMLLQALTVYMEARRCDLQQPDIYFCVR